MANFKEKLKNVFSNKLFQTIATIIACIIGLILLGRCNKVDAANFTLSDGSTSKITTSQGQTLVYESTSGFPTKKYMQIVSYGTWSYNISLSTVTNASITIINKCSSSDNVITCTNYNHLGASDGTASNVNRTHILTIGYDYVDLYYDASNTTERYTIASFDQSDLDNSYQNGYNEGYQAGIGDNQENIYNNGYNAGYSIGESDGYNEGQNVGYNNGYSAGESAGLTTGYNNGYSAGESVGLTTGYNNGYSAGYNVGSNFGIIIDSCTLTGDDPVFSYNCMELLSQENAILNFDSIRSYVDNNDLANGRFYYTIKFKDYIETDTIVNASFYSSGYGYGNVIRFYADDNLLYTLEFEDFHYNEIPYINLSDYFSESYNKIEIVNANIDYSIKTFGLCDMVSFESGYGQGNIKGYEQALKDEKAFLGFIPATLGGVVANMMPVLTYEVYGISIMNLIGLIAMIGIAIIIVKFIVG